MDHNSPVYTVEYECQDCCKCVRDCYVKAIMSEDGHASVIDQKCISCGRCIKSCPNKAKHVRSDYKKVKALIQEGKRVFASIAPSYVGSLPYRSSQLIAKLKQLGFEGVSETAIGAQEVSIEMTRVLNQASNGLYISSACPVVVDYIRKYKQEFIHNITKIASPALTHAKMLKKKYGDDIEVVFIGPCIGKKNEATEYPDLMSHALTFDELKEWLAEEFLNSKSTDLNSNESFDLKYANEGILYATEGGMNETFKKVGLEKRVQLMTVTTINSLDEALDGLKVQTLENVVFIEALSCAGGCLNGPCADTTTPTVAKVSNVLSRYNSRFFIPKRPKVVVPLDYEPIHIAKKVHSYEEQTAALKKIGKFDEQDELNCSSCGYDTCRDFIKAFLDNEAEALMCASYARQIAKNLVSATFKSIPSAVVIFDKNLCILDHNDAFVKIFSAFINKELLSRVEGIKGEPLASFGIDFRVELTDVIRLGKEASSVCKTIEHQRFEINIFNVQRGEAAGIVLTKI